jgi:hypothetical protein
MSSAHTTYLAELLQARARRYGGRRALKLLVYEAVSYWYMRP